MTYPQSSSDIIRRLLITKAEKQKDLDAIIRSSVASPVEQGRQIARRIEKLYATYKANPGACDQETLRLLGENMRKYKIITGKWYKEHLTEERK
jgi:hypothetical protein